MNTNEDTNLSLYDRLGGKKAIDDMVLDFYSRVLADPMLQPFFRHTDVDKLLSMQREFFTAALDGPLPYTGKPISEAHYGHGIERRHFAQFVNHLLDTLKDVGVKETEMNQVIGRVSVYVGDVTGSTASSG